MVFLFRLSISHRRSGWNGVWEAIVVNSAQSIGSLNKSVADELDQGFAPLAKLFKRTVIAALRLSGFLQR
jgi:hypothetical protein